MTDQTILSDCNIHALKFCVNNNIVITWQQIILNKLKVIISAGDVMMVLRMYVDIVCVCL